MADRTAGLVHALRRGLARAEQGKALSADEAAVLLEARDADLDRLLRIAATAP